MTDLTSAQQDRGRSVPTDRDRVPGRIRWPLTIVFHPPESLGFWAVW